MTKVSDKNLTGKTSLEAQFKSLENTMVTVVKAIQELKGKVKSLEEKVRPTQKVLCMPRS